MVRRRPAAAGLAALSLGLVSAMHPFGPLRQQPPTVQPWWRAAASGCSASTSACCRGCKHRPGIPGASGARCHAQPPLLRMAAAAAAEGGGGAAEEPGAGVLSTARSSSATAALPPPPTSVRPRPGPRSLARISDQSLETLRQTARLSQVAGARVKLTPSGRTSMVGCCPFHDDRSPSFSIDDAKGLYHCFGCGAGGDVVKFTMEAEGVGFSEAVALLAEQYGVHMEYEGGGSGAAPRSPAETEAARGRRAKLAAALTAAANFYARTLAGSSQVAGAARAHLFERGVSAATALRFQIGCSPAETPSPLLQHLLAEGMERDTLIAAGLMYNNTATYRGSGGSSGSLVDRFRGRLMVPIRDHRGAVVGFGGRDLPLPEAPAQDAADDGSADAAAATGPAAAATAGAATANVTAAANVTPLPTPAPRKVAKYLNSPETELFRKGTLVFGLDVARDAIRAEDVAVLVEGYFDVVALHQAGVACAVGCLGTALAPLQLEAAARYSRGRRVVLCMDADSAGRAAVERLCEGGVLEQAAASGIEARVANITAAEPGCKDPSDFIQARAKPVKKRGKGKQAAGAARAGGSPEAAGEAFRTEVVCTAKPWTVWYMDAVVAAHDHANDAAAFRACVEKLTSFLSTLSNSAERTKLGYRLAEMLAGGNDPLRLQLEMDIVSAAAAKERRRNALRRRVDAALEAGGGSGASAAAVMAQLAAGGGVGAHEEGAPAKPAAAAAGAAGAAAGAPNVPQGASASGSGAGRATRQRAASAAVKHTPTDKVAGSDGDAGGGARGGRAGPHQELVQQQQARSEPVGKVYPPLPQRPKISEGGGKAPAKRRRKGRSVAAQRSAIVDAVTDGDGTGQGWWADVDFRRLRLPNSNAALLHAEAHLLMLMVHDRQKRGACASALERSTALAEGFSSAPRQWLFDALMALPADQAGASADQLLQHLAPLAPPGYFAVNAAGGYEAVPESAVLEAAAACRGGAAAAAGTLNSVFAVTDLTRAALAAPEASLHEALAVMLRSQAVERMKGLRSQLVPLCTRIAELRQTMASAASADGGAAAAGEAGAGSAAEAGSGEAPAAAAGAEQGAGEAAEAQLQRLVLEQQELHAQLQEAQEAVDALDERRRRLAEEAARTQQALVRERAAAAASAAAGADDDADLRFMPEDMTPEEWEQRQTMEAAAVRAFMAEPSPRREVERREQRAAREAEYDAAKAAPRPPMAFAQHPDEDDFETVQLLRSKGANGAAAVNGAANGAVNGSGRGGQSLAGYMEYLTDDGEAELEEAGVWLEPEQEWEGG